MSTDLPLEALRRDLSIPTESEDKFPFHPRLSLVHIDGRVEVDFYGCPFDEPYLELCRNLILPSVAPYLASLSLASPDEGANGTCCWDLTPLTDNDATFPSLEHFSVRRSQPGDHNGVIIGSRYYDEAGVIGQLLEKAPVLDELIVPSAPDKSFFRTNPHPLGWLSIDAGYDTQSFIDNLASSDTFPNLRWFEFGEFNLTHMDDFLSHCTPFADYIRLFTSTAFQRVNAFTWRNPVASESEIAQLRALRPRDRLQFKLVRYSSSYL